MGRSARRPEHGYARRNQHQTRAYVDGNTARELQAVPRRQENRPVRQEPRRKRRPATSQKTRKNREKALQMNFAYVIFLTAAAVATLFVCVNYLQLQAANTAHRKNVTVLESQLSSLKLANDTKYDETMASVDLEKIKDIAINELGMVYAEQGQIINYNSQDGDYVRQYEDVPTNK